MSGNAEVRRRFAAAAPAYEQQASLQRLVARHLAARICAGFGDRAPPRRILDIGCGTGLLTRALRDAFPDALLVAADLAPEMAAACRERAGDDVRLLLACCDAAAPPFAAGFDLVCSSLALQWMADPVAVLFGLRRLLAPDGQLHVATLAAESLRNWRLAHEAEGVVAAARRHPSLDVLRTGFPASWTAERVLVPHGSGLAFMRGLRRLGAHVPHEQARPVGSGRMRRVMRRFERDHGAVADYEVAYAVARRATRRGVFVTGTDTGIGKTLVAACLTRVLRAEYWKPAQTGLDDEEGDSATVRRLADIAAARVHPPALALRASLSPEDAAAAEGRTFDPASLTLPPVRAGGDPPVVVEGAGGVLVPMDSDTLTVDVVARFALPVVLVARSTLGTINHTLLSLHALRERGIAVLGVVLNGPISPGNRSAIERHGRVRVLAELTPQPTLDRAAIARLASLFDADLLDDAAPGREGGGVQ